MPYRKRQPIDLKPGQKFGKLEVVRLVDEPASNGSRVYECLCQCGRLKPIIASNLVKKVSPTQSCGCGKRGPAWNRKGCGLITGLFWASIVCGARERGHDLFITVEDAWEVFQQQGGVCIFTGLPLTFRGYNQHGEQTASLDRKDSTKPYTIDNIQWVHKVVNRMKNKLGDEEFIRWCNLISQCHPRQNDAAEAM